MSNTSKQNGKINVTALAVPQVVELDGGKCDLIRNLKALEIWSDRTASRALTSKNNR